MANIEPQVGIIMGSDSDLPVMQEAAKVLDELGIPYEVIVSSAHRTPERVREYATSAEVRGLKVVIAGAGGAAHLAGVIAAMTPLPVIGVPVLSKSMAGLDSLLSMAQMPPGVPVACVAVNGAKNAGILAAQIIGTGDDTVRTVLRAYKKKMADEVLAKERKITDMGVEAYLKEKGA